MWAGSHAESESGRDGLATSSRQLAEGMPRLCHLHCQPTTGSHAGAAVVKPHIICVCQVYEQPFRRSSNWRTLRCRGFGLLAQDMIIFSQ